MKKITTISLFIFWAALVSIFVSGLIYYQNNKNQGNKITTQGSINEALVETASSSAAVALRNSATQLSLTEIAKHNSTKDCWLLLNNKVYNVTSFIAAHPGGAGTIIPNCGKDSTQAYNTKGGDGTHSVNANAMLVDYYIGYLDQIFSDPKNIPTVNPTQLSASSAGVSSSDSSATSTNAPVTSPAITSPGPAITGSVTLNMTEIVKHNSSGNCWLLLNNKVYNVTSFIAAHPGGSGTIISNCGKDSTQSYNTKGGNSTHSANANAMLVDYFIGNFDQTIGQQQIQASVQNTNAVTPTVNAGDDDDEEDDD